MAEAKKFFERCPHCYKRFGSQESLNSHVVDHRVKFHKEMVKPEHRAVLHPQRHIDMLMDKLKRAGHGR